MLKTMFKNGYVLSFFAIVATALVSITNWITSDTIAKQQQRQLQKTLSQVVPSELHDNKLNQSCMLLPSQSTVTKKPQPAYLATLNGQPSAIAIETYAPDGYNGAIKLIVGIDMTGKVTGVRVLKHNETPGLGDKIETRKSDWILSFTGKQVTTKNAQQWAVKKDGGDFDQFTGATITPRAVVKAVRKITTYFNTNQAKILEKPLSCRSQND